MSSLLFLYLKAFSVTGGIEKVNRTILLALYQMSVQGLITIKASSPYAVRSDEKYFPDPLLEGFAGNRWRFMLALLFKSFTANITFVGHINLAPAGLMLKWKNPYTRLVVIAHGIEVWSPLSGFKKRLLQKADLIITVSQFTKDKIVAIQGVSASKIKVLPNCLDPFFDPPTNFEKPVYLLDRHALRAEQKILLTVTRLSATEGYKGYDLVLQALPELIKKHPDIVYVLGGKYDALEKKRLDTIISDLKIDKHVLLTGFLPDEELLDYYCMADVFVMPSKKEGFGLVFIEAMACGTPAIGGNTDGSVEALRPGELGYVVNPDDIQELSDCTLNVLEHRMDPKELQSKVLTYFGYESYSNKLTNILLN